MHLSRLSLEKWMKMGAEGVDSQSITMRGEFALMKYTDNWGHLTIALFRVGRFHCFFKVMGFYYFG